MAADKSADAISKVLSILAPVFSSLTVQDGGENALRTKTSFLWLEKLTGETSSGERWVVRVCQRRCLYRDKTRRLGPAFSIDSQISARSI